MINKSLRWNFVFQYGYTMTNMVNALVLLPFYVKFIPNDILGIWWATGNILAWLTMSDPGVGDVLQQKIAMNYATNNWYEINRLKGAGFICGSIVVLIALGSGIILFPFLENILNKPFFIYSDLIKAFQITIFTTAASLFSFIIVGINQGLERSKTVAVSYISGNVIYLISNFLLLLVWNTGILSIAYSNLIRVIWIIVINLGYNPNKHKSERTKYDLKFTKSFSKIFLHTASSRIMGSFASNVDLILIARYLPVSNITIFEVNRRPLKMLQSLISRYSVALMPFISTQSSKVGSLELKKHVKNHFAKYLILSSLITGGLIVFGPYIIGVWLGKTKFIGSTIWILLSMSSLFWLIGYFFSNILFALGDIKVNSNLSIIRSISYLFAIWIGLHFYGLKGLVIAQLINTLLIDFTIYALRAIKLNFMTSKSILNSISLSFGFVLLFIIVSVVNQFVKPDYSMFTLSILFALFVTISFSGLVITRKYWNKV